MIYLIWNILINLLKGQLAYYISSTIYIENVLRLVLFNETHFAYHFWYLGAVLYVLLIMSAISTMEKSRSWNLRSILYAITPVLLIGDLILGKYSLIIFHREFPVILVRNWLFVGLPYFSIGLWLREQQEISNKLVTKSITITVIILAASTSILEHLILIGADLNASRDHYISTTFLAIAVFFFFKNYASSNENLFSFIGRNDSTWVYILHPILISATTFGFKIMGMRTAYSFLSPFIVYFMTVFIVEVFRTLIIKLKISFR